MDGDYVLEFIELYAPHTQKEMLGFFWALFDYLGRTDELKGIRGKRVEAVESARDLYTIQEIQSLLEVCTKPQDRVMIEVLHESACREGELVSMTIEELKWLSNGAVAAMVTGKSGIRAVYLYESIPSLRSVLGVNPMIDIVLNNG